MGSARVALSLAVTCVLVFSAATAGPLRDRFMERRKSASEVGESQMFEGSAEPIALPAGVRVEADVAYGTDLAQRMDVYVPEKAAGAPVIFMVHGGAWMIGDKKSSAVVVNKLNRWVPEGFLLISVNYRMAPEADPLEQADDVARALAFAQSKAPEWGGDPARFVLMGHSAGAHLVSLLAADATIAGKQGAKPWLGTIALDSAAFDVQRIMEQRHYRFYDKVFKDDPAYWRRASPYHRLQEAGKPMMLVCSSRREDSCSQAEAFAGKVKAAGGQVAVYPVDSSHRDINEGLGLPGPYTDAVERFIESLGVRI